MQEVIRDMSSRRNQVNPNEIWKVIDPPDEGQPPLALPYQSLPVAQLKYERSGVFSFGGLFAEAYDFPSGRLTKLDFAPIRINGQGTPERSTEPEEMRLQKSLSMLQAVVSARAFITTVEQSRLQEKPDLLAGTTNTALASLLMRFGFTNERVYRKPDSFAADFAVPEERLDEPLTTSLKRIMSIEMSSPDYSELNSDKRSLLLYSITTTRSPQLVTAPYEEFKTAVETIPQSVDTRLSRLALVEIADAHARSLDMA